MDAGIVFAAQVSYRCLTLAEFGIRSAAQVRSLATSCECVEACTVACRKSAPEVGDALRLDFVPENRSGASDAASTNAFRPGSLAVVVTIGLAGGWGYRWQGFADIGDGEADRRQMHFWPSNLPGPADLQEARAGTRLGTGPRPPDDWSGISYQRRGGRLAEITDDLSSTVDVGEKYVDAAEYESGNDAGDNEGLFSGFNNDNHRSTHPVWPYQRDRRGRMSIGSFDSGHSVGRFVLCDGSVRSLSYPLDMEVFRRSGNRRDAESAGIDYRLRAAKRRQDLVADTP
jgi:hypothetical protein